MAEDQCKVIYSLSFVTWLNSLSADDRTSILAFIRLLRELGGALAGPYSNRVKAPKIHGSRDLGKA